MPRFTIDATGVYHYGAICATSADEFIDAFNAAAVVRNYALSPLENSGEPLVEFLADVVLEGELLFSATGWRSCTLGREPGHWVASAVDEDGACGDDELNDVAAWHLQACAERVADEHPNDDVRLSAAQALLKRLSTSSSAMKLVVGPQIPRPTAQQLLDYIDPKHASLVAADVAFGAVVVGAVIEGQPVVVVRPTAQELLALHRQASTAPEAMAWADATVQELQRRCT